MLSSQAWLSNVTAADEVAGSRSSGSKSLALGDTKCKWLCSQKGGWSTQGVTRCFKKQY